MSLVCCTWETRSIFRRCTTPRSNHSLSSPDRDVLSHREGMVANAKRLKEPDRFMAYNHFFFRGTWKMTTSYSVFWVSAPLGRKIPRFTSWGYLLGDTNKDTHVNILFMWYKIQENIIRDHTFWKWDYHFLKFMYIVQFRKKKCIGLQTCFCKIKMFWVPLERYIFTNA